MFWFVNDGGPLLIAPRRALAAWEGGEPPSAGRTITVEWQYDPTGPATDYDRACAIGQPAGVIEIGGSWGIVVTAEGSAAWLGVGILAIVLVQEDSAEETLFELLHAIPEVAWKPVAPPAVIDGDGLLLLHAASTLKDVEIRTPSDTEQACIGDAILSPVPAGRYRIEYASRSTSDVSEVGFLRFRLLDSVAA